MVVTEYITIAGDPILAPKLRINDVSILGFFANVIQYPQQRIQENYSQDVYNISIYKSL